LAERQPQGPHKDGGAIAFGIRVRSSLSRVDDGAAARRFVLEPERVCREEEDIRALRVRVARPIEQDRLLRFERAGGDRQSGAPDH